MRAGKSIAGVSGSSGLKTMPRPSAGLALAVFGHCVALALAALVGQRPDEPVIETAISVTLVASSPGAQGGSSRPVPQLAEWGRKLSSPVVEQQHRSISSLDELFAKPTDPSEAKGHATLADQGAGLGEGTIDYMAAASLPPVGQRPAKPRGGIWEQVSACWRPLTRRKVTLVIDLRRDGQLKSPPKALRPENEAMDGVRRGAEAAAARAVEACSPYLGLNEKRYQVQFPAS